MRLNELIMINNTMMKASQSTLYNIPDEEVAHDYVQGLREQKSSKI
jgi:hypothetical protein